MPEMTDHFCPACRSIVYEKLLPAMQRPGFRSQMEPFKTFAELQHSAAQTQCPLCCRLSRFLSSRRGNSTEILQPTAIATQISIPRHNYESAELDFFVNVDLSLGHQPEEISLTIQELRDIPIELMSAHLTQDSDRRHQMFEIVELLDTRTLLGSDSTNVSTSSDETFEKIRVWLQDCEDHTDCQRWRTVLNILYRLPTRLIDIGEGVDANPKLVCDDSLPPPTMRYATLSHCWGDLSPVRLLRSNIATFKTGIDLESLPRTFRETIFAARKLGIQFLWIDALCIIQDDEADWQREAGRMCQVYAGSYVNFAATASHNSHGGLFRSRDPLALIPFAITDGLGVYVCWLNTYFEDVNIAPVHRRSWVVQERFLSPRIVHFGRTQVFWECGTTDASEHLAAGIPTAFYQQSNKVAIPALIEDNNGLEMRYMFLSLTWDRLVEDYSAGGMKYFRDRPVGIAGVARAIATLLGCKPEDYVNGLWRPDFVHGLMWEAASETSRPPPGADHVNCTWSWLSVEGAVHSQHLRRIDNMPRKTVAEVIDVGTVPVADEFGAIKTGAARLRGPLCQIKSRAPPDVEGVALVFGSFTVAEHALQLRWDDPRSEENFALQQAYFFLCRVRSRDLQVNNFERLPERMQEDLRNIDTIPRFHGLNDGDCEYEGLILYPVSGRKGYFTRAGHLFLKWSSSNISEHVREDDDVTNQLIFRTVDEALHNDDVPTDHYHTVDTRNMYEITII